jgi:hypothetical protein
LASARALEARHAVHAVDERDVGTPDDWVKREHSLVRLTGRHPFNVEPPLSSLLDAGPVTPSALHYVRNHGAVPRLEWASHKLAITGALPSPRIWSMDELAALPGALAPRETTTRYISDLPLQTNTRCLSCSSVPATGVRSRTW